MDYRRSDASAHAHIRRTAISIGLRGPLEGSTKSRTQPDQHVGPLIGRCGVGSWGGDEERAKSTRRLLLSSSGGAKETFEGSPGGGGVDLRIAGQR